MIMTRHHSQFFLEQDHTLDTKDTQSKLVHRNIKKDIVVYLVNGI